MLLQSYLIISFDDLYNKKDSVVIVSIEIEERYFDTNIFLLVV